jgi:hypothetical protein
MHRLKRNVLIGLAFCFNPLFVAQAKAENGNNEPQKQSAILANPVAQQFRIHGLSRFTGAQKDLLRQWLKEGVKATRQTLGDYPRRLELYVYPKPSDQPVPWAHTRRDANESIHFYVDTRFTLHDFISDWTIYHELAHLAIPYVGEQYAWFSEGFASYMQYQTMHEDKLLSEPLKQLYHNKIAPHLSRFNVGENAASVATKLMEKRNYPAAYWGGSWYFVMADQQLQNKHNMRLTALIERYQQTGRTKDQNIQALVNSLDALINDSLFGDLLYRFEHSPAKELYPTQFN